MANDYGYLGALSSISEGAGSFLNAYQTAKNMKHTQQMAELAAGVTRDQDGNLVPTAERQQEIKARGVLAGNQINENTTDSPLAKSTSDFYKTQGYAVPEGLTYSQQKGLVEPLAANKAKGLAFAGPRMDANQMRANTAYDNVIGKNYEQRLDAANRVKDLIQKARSKELVPSENLSQQLAADINMLQSGHTSVSGTEHSKPTTLFGKGGQLAHFLSGDPQAAITDADLAQMEKETNILYQDLGNQHKSKFASWIKGQPRDVQEALTSRFNESRGQYFPGGNLPGAPAPSHGMIGGAGQTDPSTAAKIQELKMLREKAGAK